jgi:hypothetical protein
MLGQELGRQRHGAISLRWTIAGIAGMALAAGCGNNRSGAGLPGGVGGTGTLPAIGDAGGTGGAGGEADAGAVTGAGGDGVPGAGGATVSGAGGDATTGVGGAPAVDAGAGGRAGIGGATTTPDGGPGGQPDAQAGLDDSRLVINEFMAANVLTAKDEGGHAGNWVELYNGGVADLPLAGYALTDDLTAPRKAILPAGLMLPGHGRLLLWLDGNPGAGASHVAVSLARTGGTLALARPDGSFVDRVSYGAQAVDFSAAREPDGSDLWAIEWHVSPGAANPAGAGRPMGPEDATLPPEPVAAAGDLSERILGYDVIPELALTIEPAQWASLVAAPDTYVPVTLTFDGRAYGPVGVHLKGMQSFEPIDQKPSLHINIDKFAAGAAFFNLSDVTLNNMHSDPSMIHERMAYWVARQAGGIPASRANHAMLTVNGQLYGLYINVETVKKRILGRWFSDTSGSLFSATDVDFQAAYIPSFELVTGPDDRTLLSGIASALATYPNPDDAMLAVGASANLDEMIRFWATTAVVAQFDSFPYSEPGDDYFAYADPTSHRLWFMPWGMDETFLSSDVDILGRMRAPVARTCLSSPACYQRIVIAVWDVLAKVEALGWLAEHDRVAAQIAPYIARDTRRHYPDTEVAAAQMDMWYFLSERRLWIGMMIPAPVPPPPPP